MSRKIKCREGDIFAIPLETTGYVVGVVARKHKTKRVCIILVYIFPEVFDEIPHQESIIETLVPERACKVIRTTTGSFNDDTWVVIGKFRDWNREQWPFPSFVRRDEFLHEKAFRITYSDDDPGQYISMVSEPWDSKLERDTICGSALLQTILTKELRPRIY